jgi:hypothetical protein
VEKVSINAWGRLFTLENELHLRLVRCHQFPAHRAEHPSGRSAESAVGSARRQFPTENYGASFVAEKLFVGHPGQDNSPPVDICYSKSRRDFRNMRAIPTVGGKTVNVRVESVKQPGVIQMRAWGCS